MSVDGLINLKPLRDPAGSQIKLDRLRLSLSSSEGKGSRSSPLIGGDLHSCLDLGTGGADANLHQQPQETGPEQPRGPDSSPPPSRRGPATEAPKGGLVV